MSRTRRDVPGIIAGTVLTGALLLVTAGIVGLGAAQRN